MRPMARGALQTPPSAAMGPKQKGPRVEPDLLRMELTSLVEHRHKLVEFEALIKCSSFEAQWDPKFESTSGRYAPLKRLWLCYCNSSARSRSRTKKWWFSAVLCEPPPCIVGPRRGPVREKSGSSPTA